jgi:hypothetical protein
LFSGPFVRATLLLCGCFGRGEVKPKRSKNRDLNPTQDKSNLAMKKMKMRKTLSRNHFFPVKAALLRVASGLHGEDEDEVFTSVMENVHNRSSTDELVHKGAETILNVIR